jgi:hypothetical protein
MYITSAPIQCWNGNFLNFFLDMGAGNETAYQLARTGSEHLFIGPEPACGISVGVAKKAVRDWTSRKQKEYWES